MYRFVFDTDKEFNNLENRLENGRCLIYEDIRLPPCFNKPKCRIGFERHDKTSSYKILIDLGITCSKKVPPPFKNFLVTGEINFMDYYDVKSFFKSLSSLY